MSDKRIVVWVQRFTDRANLMLLWNDLDTGRRKSLSAGTVDPEEAERKRADKEYELNHGLHKDLSRMTWERFRELFEAEYLPNLRPGTQKKYREVLDLFEELARPSRLRGVNERTLATFLTGMRKREVRGRVGMAAGTMKVYLQLLHGALAYAVEQKLLPECPEFPKVKVPKKRSQPVPVEAFERLLAKAPDDDWRALLLTAWLAGLRSCEAYAQEWESGDTAPCLDFGRNRVVLPAEFVKGAEDQWVPLDPQLRAVLEALPRAGRHVFQLRARDGHRLALSSVCDRVNYMARRAGVKLSLHPLRRGFGCRYAGKVPAQVLQRLMRHRDIKTTMDYYANVDAAVEQAVLGPQVSSMVYSGPQPQEQAGEGRDATPEGRTDNGTSG
jgi:integrase